MLREMRAIYPSTSQRTFFKRVVCLIASGLVAGRAIGLAFRLSAGGCQWQKFKRIGKQLQAPKKALIYTGFLAFLRLHDCWMLPLDALRLDAKKISYW